MDQTQLFEAMKKFIAENLTIEVTKEYGSYGDNDYFYVKLKLNGDVISSDCFSSSS